MGSGFDADAVSDVVSQRADVLACLVDGPKHNRDLQDELGVSRSTAYKALRELEEHSLVERTDDGFGLTLTGRLAFDQHARYTDAIEVLCVPGSLLTVLPSDAIDSLAVLRGADVVFAERHAPNLPVNTLEDVVREATALRGMSPVLLPLYVDLFHECIVDGDLDANLLLETPVVEHLFDQYRTAAVEVVETGDARLWNTDETLPFGLVVVDEPDPMVALIVYDDNGGLRGVITNSTASAVAWGRSVWERYRSDARAITLE